MPAVADDGTIPLAIVVATAIEMNAPMKLSTAEIRTATIGLSAPVAIDVAIALAVSWKPLVKSNATAAAITITRTRVVELILSRTLPRPSAEGVNNP